MVYQCIGFDLRVFGEMECSMDEMITFLLTLTGSLSRKSLTMSPGLSKPLNHYEMNCGIHNSLHHPFFYLY